MQESEQRDRQSVTSWSSSDRQSGRHLFSQVVSTMFSCLSSGSSTLFLHTHPGCVKNSITAPGPQLGRVAVIKLHHSASRGSAVSPFSFLSLSLIFLTESISVALWMGSFSMLRYAANLLIPIHTFYGSISINYKSSICSPDECELHHC